MILKETYTLSNGVRIPKIGFGTWLIDDSRVCQAVLNAIDVGYTHIDTAEAYGNERGVGEAIRKSGLDRNEIFVTTKLAAEIKDYQGAKKAIDQSLKTLGLDFVDLMIIHSPEPWNEFRGGDHYYKGNIEAYKALEDAYNDGKIKAIGVSNFEESDLQNILDNCTVKPMVNQILAHIGNTPFDLIDFCRHNDILVEAYSPIGHGELYKNEAIAAMADKYGVSIAQLCIRYCLQLDLLPLPKAESKDHMMTNTDVDFRINPTDMEILKSAKPVDYGQSGDYPVFSK